jgi:hypothetical protein
MCLSLGTAVYSGRLGVTMFGFIFAPLRSGASATYEERQASMISVVISTHHITLKLMTVLRCNQ